MITKKHSEQIKQQLISQIENSNIQQKEELKTKIQSMSEKQLEEFIKQQQDLQKNQGGECVFCSIIYEKIPSYKIDENSFSIAILEINPISKGHVIVTPKAHSETAPKESFDLAEGISKKLSHIFNPKKVEIVTSTLFGHEVINVFPIYENETLHSQRKQASQEELQSIQKQILKAQPSENKKLPELKKPKTKIYTDENTWLPKRIP